MTRPAVPTSSPARPRGSSFCSRRSSCCSWSCPACFMYLTVRTNITGVAQGRSGGGETEVERELASRSISRVRWQLVALDGAIIVAVGALGTWYARRTLRPISELFAAQKRFVADASHELRTPLAIMKADFEVALRDEGGGGEPAGRSGGRASAGQSGGTVGRASRWAVRRAARGGAQRPRRGRPHERHRRRPADGVADRRPPGGAASSRRSTWASSCAARPRPCARWGRGPGSRWR